MEISQFLDLPLELFYEGFKTKHDVFSWAASMKYFDVKHFRTTGTGIQKIMARRAMYAEFVQWVKDMQPRSPLYNELSEEERIQRIHEDALTFFKKKEELNNLVNLRLRKLRLKESFSGDRVREWTQIGNHWKGVKLIMDEVRQRLGGEQGVSNFLDANSEDALKSLVLQVQTELGLNESGFLSNLLEKATLNDISLSSPKEDTTNNR